MDNQPDDLLPDVEQLARLYEVRDRYGLTTAGALSGPCTPSEQHRRLTGHPLRFGCCRASEAPRADR